MIEQIRAGLQHSASKKEVDVLDEKVCAADLASDEEQSPRKNWEEYEEMSPELEEILEEKESEEEEKEERRSMGVTQIMEKAVLQARLQKGKNLVPAQRNVEPIPISLPQIPIDPKIAVEKHRKTERNDS